MVTSLTRAPGAPSPYNTLCLQPNDWCVRVESPWRAPGSSLVGTALLLATEWIQIFEIRDLAIRVPEVLNRLDAEGVGLDDIGAMAAMAALAVGWISLCVLTWRSGLFARRPPLMIIAGFFATPFLSAVLPPVYASAVGNTILGAGLIGLGRDLSRQQAMPHRRN